MKIINSLLIVAFTFLALTTSAHALSPSEELQQMVAQLQQAPNDNALREKIIKLATKIKPAPAIPEAAREPFIMGATVLKKASDPAGASKAVDLFTQALNLAPWFADAYYNRALAREAAGQYNLAINDLETYLKCELTDAERRETQNDTALRERIIKLAPTLKPAPVLPDEAERWMVRGSAAFKGATSAAGYLDAAKEFEQATLAAPWYGDAYFNLGVAQDKAEDYAAALSSLKLAQLASPGSKEIKLLIYEVETIKTACRSRGEYPSKAPPQRECGLNSTTTGSYLSNR